MGPECAEKLSILILLEGVSSYFEKTSRVTLKRDIRNCKKNVNFTPEKLPLVRSRI
jgi:hypothetical protein